MGDGMSDSGWRGELGEDGNDEWLFDKIVKDNPLVIHQQSVLRINHTETIRRLKDAGKICVKRRDDWLEISAQR